MWVAGTKFGWIEADPDWMPPLADFLEELVQVGQSVRSSDLVHLPDRELIAAVMSHTYLSDSHTIARDYRAHLLAPNGSCAFDRCALTCVDWLGTSRIVGLNRDWLPDRDINDLPDEAFAAVRVPTEVKNSVLESAVRWLRGSNDFHGDTC